MKKDLVYSYKSILSSGKLTVFRNIIVDKVNGEFETIFYYIRLLEHNIRIAAKIHVYIHSIFHGDNYKMVNILYNRNDNLKLTYAKFHNMAEKNKLFENGKIPVLPDYINGRKPKIL